MPPADPLEAVRAALDAASEADCYCRKDGTYGECVPCRAQAAQTALPGLERALQERDALRQACGPLVTFFDDTGETPVDRLDWLQVDASLIRPICNILRGAR